MKGIHRIRVEDKDYDIDLDNYSTTKDAGKWLGHFSSLLVGSAAHLSPSHASGHAGAQVSRRERRTRRGLIRGRERRGTGPVGKATAFFVSNLGGYTPGPPPQPCAPTLIRDQGVDTLFLSPYLPAAQPKSRARSATRSSC
jgi:hypothetical protein